MAGDTESFAENTALTHLMGDHPRTRILVTLLAESDRHGLHKSEIARLAGLSRTTVYNHLGDLRRLDVVQGIPSTNGYTVYRLNRDSTAAKRLAQLEWAALDRVSEQRHA